MDRLVDDLHLRPDADLPVVEIGAGRGALTEPLARAGVEVWAVEPDPVWFDYARPPPGVGRGG